MRNTFVEFYQCPEELAFSSLQRDGSEPEDLESAETASDRGGFTQTMVHSRDPRTACPDIVSDLANLGSHLDASRLVDDLRLERYEKNSPTRTSALLASEGVRRVYYQMRSALPTPLRHTVQRLALRDWSELPFPRWPVDTSVEEIFERQLLMAMRTRELKRVPFIWYWPDGASSAAMMTHDVEAPAGLAFVPGLMDVDDEYGIKASYQIVPEQRYTVPMDMLETIRVRQCEVNVHGLDHDGNLFRDRQTFLRKCKRINKYIQEFQAEGFRSASMYRNVDWYQELHVSYDMSLPNVAHLEPQRGGCCTVFPYFIGKILEIPLTTVQDYSLFHILRDYSIDLWKKQIERIMEKHGLISFIAHPDYLLRRKPLEIYKALLAYLAELRRHKKVWITRPGDVNRWWRQRSAMQLTFENGKWRIQGEGRERARVAVAHNQNGRISIAFETEFEGAIEFGSSDAPAHKSIENGWTPTRIGDDLI